MTVSVIVTFALIVLARIVDVSLDTVRTVSIVQGRSVFAASLGFVQAVVYVCVIGKVLQDAQQPAYVVAYGLGFALGTYVGITIEERLAFGHQLASLYTRKGAVLAEALSAGGYRVVEVQGHLRDSGDGLTILYVQVPRKRISALMRDAAGVDDSCFCIVNDVRLSGFAARWTRRVSVDVPAASRPRALGADHAVR